MKLFVSLQGGTEAEEQRDVVTEREANLQRTIYDLIESQKQQQALREKHCSELQETIRMYVQRRGVSWGGLCYGLHIHVQWLILPAQLYNIQYGYTCTCIMYVETIAGTLYMCVHSFTGRLRPKLLHCF